MATHSSHSGLLFIYLFFLQFHLAAHRSHSELFQYFLQFHLAAHSSHSELFQYFCNFTWLRIVVIVNFIKFTFMQFCNLWLMAFVMRSTFSCNICVAGSIFFQKIRIKLFGSWFLNHEIHIFHFHQTIQSKFDS